jgi:hypothetical protein
MILSNFVVIRLGIVQPNGEGIDALELLQAKFLEDSLPG